MSPVAVAAAALLAAALLAAWPLARDLPVGRPGDGAIVEGMSAPARLQGQPGRWTSGAGRLHLPRTALPLTVTLRVQAPDARIPDRLTITLNGRPIHDATLERGWQLVRLELPPPGGASTLGLHTATSPDRDGPPVGLFVARVDVREGGPDAWRRLQPSTVFSITLLTFGMCTLASRLLARGPAHTAGIAAAGLWGVAALFLFRSPSSLWWPAMAASVWLTIAALAGWPARWRIAVRPPLAGAAFLTLSVAAVGLLFVEAITEGAVLGQAHMLDPYFPWRAYLAAEPSRPTPPFGDVPMLVYPFLAFTRERLLAGAFPLWTAAVNAGQPFFAAYQAAVLSPITWVALLVPLPQATVVIAALRMGIGGAGMWVFARGIGLPLPAAACAGLAFLLNPFTVVWLEHPPGGVPPWLPWMLWAADRCGRGRRFGGPALALTAALVVLGGHPHTGLFAAALAGSFGLATALTSERRWLRAATVGAALGLGALLAAVQILPFLEYLSLSRGGQWRNAYGLNPFHAPAAALPAALVPNFFGDHHTGNYAGPLNYLEQVMYAGLPTLVLAGLALAVPRREWRVAFFAASALVATLIVYGAPGVNHLLSLLPLVKAATLTRMPLVAIAAIVVLAGYGVERLLTADADERRRLALTAIGIGIAIAIAVLWALDAQRPLLLRRALVGYSRHWSAWAGLLASGTVLIVLGRWRGLLAPAGAAGLVTGLMVLDLFVFARGFHGLLPAARVYPLLPEIARLRAEPGPFRVLGAKGALMPNSAMVYGLQDVRAYDGLGVAWYADLLDVPLAFAPAHQMHEAHTVDSRILDLLNVRYVLAPPDLPVPAARYARVPGTRAPLYESRLALPRAFLVDGYTVLSGNPARRALRDGTVDVRRQAVLEAEPPAADRPQAAAAADRVGTARIAAYDHERVEIETRADGARLVVLTDTDFPGWRATVDGRPAAIARANFAFRAVAVPAGRHRVVFEYAPESFRRGALASVAALLVLAAWALAPALPRRVRADASP